MMFTISLHGFAVFAQLRIPQLRFKRRSCFWHSTFRTNHSSAELLYDAEMLESHVLHTLFLAAPDFLGVDSVIPLADTHKDVVVLALR